MTPRTLAASAAAPAPAPVPALALTLTLVLLSGASCTKHEVTAKTEHRITVDPITINVNLRVDKKLDEAFAFEDELDSSLEKKN